MSSIIIAPSPASKIIKNIAFLKQNNSTSDLPNVTPTTTVVHLLGLLIHNLISQPPLKKKSVFGTDTNFFLKKIAGPTFSKKLKLQMTTRKKTYLQ